MLFIIYGFIVETIKNISIGIASSEGKSHIHSGGTGKSMWGGDQDAFLEPCDPVALDQACVDLVYRAEDSECPLETTEWSIVMNQETKELIYYHRENYETAYIISAE